jgi:hypothetical protein
MDKAFNMKIEPDAFVSEKGIEISLYIDGTYDLEPTITKGWSKIVDEIFEMNAIPYSNTDRIVFPYYGDREGGVDDIHDTIVALETVASKMRKRLEASYIYNHSALLADKDGLTYHNDKEKYTYPFDYKYLYQPNAGEEE